MNPAVEAYEEMRERLLDYKAAAERREADYQTKLAKVRSALALANETIEKQRIELERFRPVMVEAIDWEDCSLLVDDEVIEGPITLYAKDDHA